MGGVASAIDDEAAYVLLVPIPSRSCGTGCVGGGGGVYVAKSHKSEAERWRSESSDGPEPTAAP